MGWAEIGFGTVLGFALSEVKGFLRRKRRVKGLWQALQAEVAVCGEYSQIFLRDKISAPSYRIPTLCYGAALPQLLADAGIEYADVRALTLFYAQADSFNRGLDQAELARNDPDRLEVEYQRCRLKAEKLVPSEDASASFYKNAMDVLSAKVK